MEYDFSGWATRNNLKCSDGRTIMKDAFKHNDGSTVPLVWNHQHNDPNNILGHAMLKNRDSGVYAYCKFNETESGQNAKLLVEHGDVSSLSIYANQLKQQGGNVLHGAIREVSLVLAGANPGAFIDDVIRHGEEFEDEATIYTGEEIELFHADAKLQNGNSESEDESIAHADKGKEESEVADETKEETIGDIIHTMNEKQKNALYALIAKVRDDDSDDDSDDDIEHSEGGEDYMKHNVFEPEEAQTQDAMMHTDMPTLLANGKRMGSLKEAWLSHAEEYGIDGIEWLFPEAKTLNNPPEFIKRKDDWVAGVMRGVHHSPFSRIKSVFADITEDEARAKGYIKGKYKKEEVFTLLKRTTVPCTVYKKQKIDRDDMVDITDFDVLAWLKAEMRMMLDEELARAILIGDGRLSSSDDKIKEDCIRPIIKDEELFTIRTLVNVAKDADSDVKAKAFIRAVIKSRKDYRGSGNPTLYTTEDMLTDCLLLEDNMGRVLYESVDKLKNVLRVANIVTVPVMEGVTGPNDLPLMGLIVNLNDYNVGADKGGAINMFDDFDIDYNQQKYLIETRCSGALTKPYSAMVFELNVATA